MTRTPRNKPPLKNKHPSHTDPNGLDQGVRNKKQCNDVGCINIIKECKNRLKNCAVFWNTLWWGKYHNAVNVSLVYFIEVQGRDVYDAQYPHTKNANQVPFFHGVWGNHRHGDPWGHYTYRCYGFEVCDGYMSATDEITFSGLTAGTLKGQSIAVAIGADWAENKGKVVKWTGGGQIWAGLPPGK
jgi:hypothetical protein